MAMLDVQAVADRLSVDYMTARRVVEECIPHIDVGTRKRHCFRVDAADLEEWIRASKGVGVAGLSRRPGPTDKGRRR